MTVRIPTDHLRHAGSAAAPAADPAHARAVREEGDVFRQMGADHRGKTQAPAHRAGSTASLGSRGACLRSSFNRVARFFRARFCATASSTRLRPEPRSTRPRSPAGGIAATHRPTPGRCGSSSLTITSSSGGPSRGVPADDRYAGNSRAHSRAAHAAGAHRVAQCARGTERSESGHADQSGCRNRRPARADPARRRDDDRGSGRGRKSLEGSPSKWFGSLATARPADFEQLPPAEAALAEPSRPSFGSALPRCTFRPRAPCRTRWRKASFYTSAARAAIVLPDGRPFAIEPTPLVPEATVSIKARDRLDLRMVTTDGRDASRARLVVLHPRAALRLREPRLARTAARAHHATANRGAGRLADHGAPARRRSATAIIPRRQGPARRAATAVEGVVDRYRFRSRSLAFHARLLAHSDIRAASNNGLATAAGSGRRSGAPPPQATDDSSWNSIRPKRRRSLSGSRVFA